MSEGNEMSKSGNALAEVGKTELKTVDVPSLYKPGGGGFDTKSRVALGLIALSLFASLFIRVDQVVTAPGKVIPSTRVKSVQHLEGGIVQDLAVKEGDFVKEGAVLVQLNLATSGINIEELKSRRAALEMSRARLIGEATGKQPVYPTEITTTYPDLYQTEQSTYLARVTELQGIIAVNDSQLLGNQGKVGELQAKLDGLENRAVTTLRELEITRELVRERLVSQLEYLTKKREYDSLTAEIASMRQTISSAQASVGQSRARKVEEEGKFRRRAADELTTLERQLASLKEEIDRASDQRDRAIIRSPIDGIVKNLKLQAVGNVVRQGEPIMEVVPVDEVLVVETRLSPADRGYVSMDQPAEVKVSAYDFLRYGTLPGKVSQIAADTDPGSEDTGPYYRLIVSTDKAFFGTPEAPLRISPGMTAEVDINVGSQPFIYYLLKPVLKLQQEAFREP
ncbi:MAG TPA: HlyD family type I secretion periplasmic adaptor subunit [Limnobacter sp.]|nr:HlyD family type I secretion periplasmic adaptor subunit [Limnobacter sp.]